MAGTNARKWDRKYAAGEHGNGQPAQVLRENTHLLPDSGTALDLACGHGANALLLAHRGLTVQAWDISGVAIERLAAVARSEGLPLAAEVRDAVRSPPEPDSFDVITVSRFLERTIVPAIAGALRVQGLLFYQTFLRETVSGKGPRNPSYRLEPNELLSLFPQLHIIHYREDGTVGDPGAGVRDEAMLIAQRR